MARIDDEPGEVRSLQHRSNIRSAQELVRRFVNDCNAFKPSAFLMKHVGFGKADGKETVLDAEPRQLPLRPVRSGDRRADKAARGAGRNGVGENPRHRSASEVGFLGPLLCRVESAGPTREGDMRIDAQTAETNDHVTFPAIYALRSAPAAGDPVTCPSCPSPNGSGSIQACGARAAAWARPSAAWR